MGKIVISRKFEIAISLVLLVILGTIIFDKYKSTTCFHKEDKLPIYSVDREDKKVSVTFDVNWAEHDNIYEILDILDKYNVKGTFFIMGGWVEYSDENIQKLKDISERGHEIGNHSYMHPQYTNLSKEKMILEAQKSDEVIQKYTEIKPKLFRFPSGAYNNLAVETMQKNYVLIQWSVDSVDWKELGQDVEYEKVKKGIKKGSIILFHNNAKYTPANLDRLLNEYQNQGFEFVKVSDLIYSENFFINNEGIQFQNN